MARRCPFTVMLLAVLCLPGCSGSSDDHTFEQVTAPGIEVPELFLERERDLPQAGYTTLGETATHVVFLHSAAGRVDATVSVRRTDDRWSVYGVQWCQEPK